MTMARAGSGLFLLAIFLLLVAAAIGPFTANIAKELPKPQVKEVEKKYNPVDSIPQSSKKRLPEPPPGWKLPRGVRDLTLYYYIETISKELQGNQQVQRAVFWYENAQGEVLNWVEYRLVDATGVFEIPGVTKIWDWYITNSGNAPRGLTTLLWLQAQMQMVSQKYFGSYPLSVIDLSKQSWTTVQLPKVMEFFSGYRYIYDNPNAQIWVIEWTQLEKALPVFIPFIIPELFPEGEQQ